MDRNLWILHELLRGFFYYNPTRYIVLPGEISYAFDVKNTKLDIQVNAREAISNIYQVVESMPFRKMKKVLAVLKNLELLFSGWPQHNETWIKVDKELSDLRESLFKDSQVSIRQDVRELFEISIKDHTE